MNGSGFAEDEGNRLHKRGEKVQSKKKLGCRKRNRAANLWSGFVMGKVTSYFFEMSNFAFNELFSVLNNHTFREQVGLKICEKVCLYQLIIKYT